MAYVDLTIIEARIGNAEHIGGEADGNQLLGRLPIEDLRARESRPGAVGILNQRLHCIGPRQGAGAKQPHMAHLGADRVEQSLERSTPVHSQLIGQRPQGGLSTDNDHATRPVSLALDSGQRFRDCSGIIGNDRRYNDGRSLLRAIRHRSSFWDRRRNKAISRRCCCPAVWAGR